MVNGTFGDIDVAAGIHRQMAWGVETGVGALGIHIPGGSRRASSEGGHHALRRDLADLVAGPVGYIQVALAVAHHAHGVSKQSVRAGAVGGARCA